MTPEERAAAADARAAALAALTHQILDGFHGDPASPYSLVSRLTRAEFAKLATHLGNLERAAT